jgi:hypothetical protein
MATAQTTERREFLADVFTTAIESGSYGWFTVEEYVHDGDAPYAVLVADDDHESYRVTPATISHGIGTLQRAGLRPINDTESVLHNAKTGQRLYVSVSNRRRMLAESRLNDAGALDVIDALALLEIGLFGAVTYA